MIAILATVGGLFGAKGRLATIIGAGSLLFAALTVIIIAKGIYDRSVIANHDAKQDAVTTKADRAADAVSAGERRDDDTRIGNEAVQLEKVTNNAQNDRDRRIARMRCIRLQQDARATGRVAPAC